MKMRNPEARGITDPDYAAKLIHYLEKLYQIRTIAEIHDGKTVIVYLPHDATRDRRGRWFFINDNGGEFNVGMINDDRFNDDAPYMSNGRPVSCLTAAYRVNQALRGQHIDYDMEIDEELEQSIINVVGNPL